MIRLYLLGAIDARIENGDGVGPVLAQPKRLALLAHLAATAHYGPSRRDRLLALFWPELDQEHARNALSKAVHFLRRSLGDNALISRSADELAIDSALVWSDVVAFASALDAGRLDEALELYRGDLLPGLFLHDAPGFEEWLEGERSTLRARAVNAARLLSERDEREGNLTAAVDRLRWALDVSDVDEPMLRRLVQLLDRLGDRAGAVRAYEKYAERLSAELEVEPCAETKALVAQIRAGTLPRDDPSASAKRRALDPLREAPANRSTVETPLASAASPVADARSSRRGPRGATWVAAAVVVLFLVGAATWQVIPRSGLHTPRSIAVLPCTRVVQDAEKWYLGEIITQDLIAEVAKRRVFERVIAFPSVARYAGTTQSPQEIGAELRVEGLLYCKYRQIGSRERVSVELVDRRNARVLWSDHFEHDLTATAGPTLPMFVVDGLTRAAGLASSRLPLGVGSPVTRDLRALNLYREGQVFLNRFTSDAVHRSISLFRETLHHDSAFALPYVGLARAYNVLGIAFGALEPREAFPLMKQAAEHALTLDAGLAEPHVLLGEYEMAFGWNWAEAERRLRQAIRLDPYDPNALQSLAYYLTLVGRYDEVARLTARAIEVSPADPIVWSRAARNCFLAGRFGEALGFLQKGLELAPNFPPLLLETGHLYAEMGNRRQSVEYLGRADSLSGHQVIIRGRLGYAHALAGDWVAARAILRELKRGAAGARPPAKTATAIAVVHIGLGETDSAFAWLNIAYELRSGNLVHVLRTPAGWRLAADPRYGALLDRIGLAPAVLTPVVVASRKPE